MSTGMGAHAEGSPSNSVNFRDLEIGKTETRVIYLKNESDRETHYSILSEENGIFKITGKQGNIPANCNGHPVRYDKGVEFSCRFLSYPVLSPVLSASFYLCTVSFFSHYGSVEFSFPIFSSIFIFISVHLNFSFPYLSVL
jgi:hypothetical protein